MENGIQIKTYKVDYEFLKNNYLDPKTWELRYTIFNYKGMKVDVFLGSINVQSKTLEFRIKGTFANTIGGYEDYSVLVCYPLERTDFTPKMFQNSINSSLKSVVRMLCVFSSTTDADDKFDLRIQNERSIIGDLFNDLYYDKLPEAFESFIEEIRDNYIRDNETVNGKRGRYKREYENLLCDEYLGALDAMINEEQSQPEDVKEIIIPITDEIKEYEKLVEDFENMNAEDFVDEYGFDAPEGLE